jgi:hypothetical protein
MKKLFIILSLVVSSVGFAQTKSPDSKCELCNFYEFTSISQLEDVKETDAFYIHLQSLVERYSINVSACSKNTFGGSQILTNAAFAQMLSTALQRLDDLKAVVIDGKTEASKAKILEKIKFHSFDFFNHKYTTLSQVKDVKASDCYYQAAQILLEDYKIDITNKAGLMQADKPANGKNVGTLLKQVFGLTNLDVSKYSKDVITKGQFAMMLNETLDHFNEIMSSAAYD